MNFESFTGKPEKEPGFNPEYKIGSFQDVYPSIAFYALSKKLDKRWGGEQNGMLAEVIKGQMIEFPPGLVAEYEEIKKSVQGNRETLGWLAFTVNKSQAEQDLVRDQMVRHKGFSHDQASQAQKMFAKFYQAGETLLDLSSIESFIEKDVASRQARLPFIKEKISEATTFFQPQSSQIEEIIYLPTNPLEKSQAGGGFRLGRKFYINAEHGNEVNEVHEFLHSIINPITDQLQLSQAEADKILDLCPRKLRGYEYPLSILTEEIIRTYHTGFKVENKPGFERFKSSLLLASQEEIDKQLASEKKKGEAGAKSAAELISSDILIKRYYEKYSQDLLAERIWGFFESYQKSGVGFERYFLENYREILK